VYVSLAAFQESKPTKSKSTGPASFEINSITSLERPVTSASIMSRALLICGATGKQGGAVINKLLEEKADFDILAVTRDASSASAQRLLTKSPKIKLVQGNLAEPSAIFRAAAGVTKSPIWGVFSVQVLLTNLPSSWNNED
jgi:hypothetical protein